MHQDSPEKATFFCTQLKNSDLPNIDIESFIKASVASKTLSTYIILMMKIKRLRRRYLGKVLPLLVESALHYFAAKSAE